MQFSYQQNGALFFTHSVSLWPSLPLFNHGLSLSRFHYDLQFLLTINIPLRYHYLSLFLSFGLWQYSYSLVSFDIWLVALLNQYTNQHLRTLLYCSLKATTNSHSIIYLLVHSLVCLLDNFVCLFIYSIIQLTIHSFVN